MRLSFVFVKKITKKVYSNLIQGVENVETIIMDTENSKTSETHKFKFYLTVKIDFKNPNKNIALVNVSIYSHMKKHKCLQ